MFVVIGKNCINLESVKNILTRSDTSNGPRLVVRWTTGSSPLVIDFDTIEEAEAKWANIVARLSMLPELEN